MAKQRPKKRRGGRGPGGARGASGFGGGGGMPGGMGDILAQVQQLQQEMEAAQESLKDEIVEASVGGGMVKISMSATHEIKAVEIAPDVVDPDDVEMLQDLLLAAFSEAIAKAQQVTEEKMEPFQNAMDMGGLGNLFG